MMANEGIADALNIISKKLDDSTEIANPQEESFDNGQSKDSSDLAKLYNYDNSGELMDEECLFD